jgi:hypothetical protein
VHADEGVADIEPGVGADRLNHDRVVEPFNGDGRQWPTGVRHRDDGDLVKPESLGTLALDDQGSVEVLAALDRQERPGVIREGILETVHYPAGHGEVRSVADRLPEDLARAAADDEDLAGPQTRCRKEALGELGDSRPDRLVGDDGSGHVASPIGPWTCGHSPARPFRDAKSSAAGTPRSVDDPTWRT